MSVNPQQMAALLRLSGSGANMSGLSTVGTGLGDAGSALGIYNALNSNTPQGDVAAAANAAKLAGQTGIFGSNTGLVNSDATGALDALAAYQGIKQGGWQGYGQALGAGMQGAGELLGNQVLTGVGGDILAPLAVYNAVNNWQSGATGSDALQGAEAGAAVGSIIPGVGTVIGGLVGGAIGAASSAFGGGEKDPETENWQGLINATGGANATQAGVQSALTGLNPEQNFNLLTGVMDIKGRESPFEQTFGHMGETNALNDMTNEVNSAIKSGQLSANASPEEAWSKVVQPWLNKQGATITPETGGYQLQGVLQNLLGEWETGQLTNKTALDSGNQTDTSLAAYQGKYAPPPTTPGNSTGMIPVSTVYTGNNPVGRAVTGSALPSPTTAPPTLPQQLPASAMMSVGPINPTHIAEGGHMKKRTKNPDLDRLREVYKGPLFSKREHFDDGGSAYLDYFTPSGAGASYAPVSMPNGGSYDPNTGLVIDSQGNVSSAGSGGTGPINLPNGSAFDPTTGLMIDAQGNVTGGGGSGSPTSGGGKHSISGDLQTAGQNLTGANGIAGILKSLGALAPLGAMLIRPKTNTNTPSAAPGMTQGATNPHPSTFNRTQVASPLSALSGAGGSGPSAPSIGGAGSPSNLPGGAPMSLQDWYTYGSRPEASFFNNNQVPLAQATGISTGQAKGGRQSALSELGGDFGMPEFDSATEHHVNGPGDGTSDNIPAQLSDGEYVMDANTVSMLGNGSNKAGAARLDALRENLRKHAAKPMAKGKQFMKAKSPEQYMGKAAPPKIKGKGKPIAFDVEGEG